MLFTQKLIIAAKGVAIEVRDTKVYIVCPKCHERKPLSKYGFRMMPNGEVRSQSWCTKCRSK
jgi:hypothetical protein